MNNVLEETLQTIYYFNIWVLNYCMKPIVYYCCMVRGTEYEVCVVFILLGKKVKKLEA
jgi:hypothetical protein